MERYEYHSSLISLLQLNSLVLSCPVASWVIKVGRQNSKLRFSERRWNFLTDFQQNSDRELQFFQQRR